MCIYTYKTKKRGTKDLRMKGGNLNEWGVWDVRVGRACGLSDGSFGG
jgi:hypothetical protein